MRLLPLLSGILLLGLTPLQSADDKALPTPEIALNILQDEGYSFHTLTLKTPTAMRLISTSNGVENTLIDIPPIDYLTVAVKLGKENQLLKIITYGRHGRYVSMEGADLWKKQAFSTVSTKVSSTDIQLNAPFIELRSPTEHFQLTLTTSK